MEESEVGKEAVVVGIDESDHGIYALRWTVDHLFSNHRHSPPFKLIVVHAKPNPVSVIGGVGPGAGAVLPLIDKDLKRTAASVIGKAKSICNSNSIPDVEYKVVEGDARNVLSEAVEKSQASMLVVGSHGYGALKRTFLGSISDYCTHHINSNVLIVKMPPTVVEPTVVEPTVVEPTVVEPTVVEHSST